MRKSKLKSHILFSIFISAVFFLFVSPQPAEAINCAFSPLQLRQGDGTGGTFDPRNPNITFSFPLFNPANPAEQCDQAGGANYKFKFDCSTKDVNLNNGTLEFTFNLADSCELKPGSHPIVLVRDGNEITRGSYAVQAEPGGGFGTCKITFGPPEGKRDFSINDKPIQAYVYTNNLKDDMTYWLAGNALGKSNPAPFKGKEGMEGIKTFNLNGENSFGLGAYTLTVSTIISGTTTGGNVCSERFNVTVGGGTGGGGGTVFQPKGCECTGVTKAEECPKEKVFIEGQGCCQSLDTGIGCIPTEPGGFVSFMFKYLLGFSGMIAFFLILAAGFQILTSAGNPEKLQAGQQLLTAAVIGVMVLVFSIVILQIIGTNILGGLPGFPEFRRVP